VPISSPIGVVLFVPPDLYSSEFYFLILLNSLILSYCTQKVICGVKSYESPAPSRVDRESGLFWKVILGSMDLFTFGIFTAGFPALFE